MSQKEHGTSAKRVQSGLRWSCDENLADRICSFNRHYAENAGYWDRSTTFFAEETQAAGEITYYDSVTGKPLFYSPRGRSWDAFVKESKIHVRATPRAASKPDSSLIRRWPAFCALL